jgi:hypothetical protein
VCNKVPLSSLLNLLLICAEVLVLIVPFKHHLCLLQGIMSSSSDSPLQNINSMYHTSPPNPGNKRRHGESGNTSLAKQKRTKCDPVPSHPVSSPQLLVVHRVKCYHHSDHSKEEYYEDAPRLFAGDSKATALHGETIITEDLFGDQFADDNPHISFIVLKSYDCKAYHDRMKNEFTVVPIPASVAKSLSKFKPHFSLLRVDGEVSEPESEEILYVSKDLQMAMEVVRAAHPEYFPSEAMDTSLDAPYLSIYHARSIMDGYSNQPRDNISNVQQSHIRCLVDYVQHSRHKEFEEADAEFVRGMVSEHHFTKLFGPNEIVVRDTSAGPIAYIVEEAQFEAHSFRLNCWTWEFDGIFYKSRSTWDVEWPPHANEVSVSTFTMYPLKYDKSGVGEVLRKRGAKFWEFRKAVLIEHESESSAFELRAVWSRCKRCVVIADILTRRVIGI